MVDGGRHRCVTGRGGPVDPGEAAGDAGRPGPHEQVLVLSVPTSIPLPISIPTSLPISLPAVTSLPISLPTSLPISLPIGL